MYSLKNKTYLISILVYLFIGSTLYIDYYFDVDLSSGGSSGDFKNTFPLVINIINYNFDDWSNYSRHFPLHYFLLSIIYKIIGDINLVRVFYILISIIIPLLLYFNLKYIYIKTDRNKLLIFSSLILLLPFLRSSIVWPNAHATGLIFFLIGNLFLQKFISLKKIHNLIFTIIFLSFAVYSVQYFAIFFGILLITIYKKFNLKIFLFTLFLCIISSIPGFYFLKILPSSGDIPFSNNIFNVLIINFSIICFYLFFFLNKDSLSIILNNFNIQKNRLFTSSIILIFFLIAIYFFDYEYNVGGGFFYKLSNLLINEKYIFYISAIIGGFLFFYSSETKIKEMYKTAIILITFFLMTYSYMIFQKYFEPLFILSCLFYIKNVFFSSIFNEKNLILVFIFFMTYLFSSVIYVKFIFE